MLRSRIFSALSSSRHSASALSVRGLSQMPSIIASRPASMRLAMAISPSRDSSSTEPISRRYMRTGSSVVPASSSDADAVVVVPSLAGFSAAPWASSLSSPSITLMPISESCAMVSSICSDDTCSGGKAEFISS